MLAHLRLFLTALTIFVGFATLGGGWWLAGRAVRPVLEITDEAEAIGAGTLQRRIRASADLTEYDRLVAVLNTMLDRLETAFDVQRRFIGDASHELRSPLTALRGELELARMRERSPQEYQRVIDSALEEVDRLTRVTEDLLTLARADAGVMRARKVDGDVAALARTVADRMRPRATAHGVRIVIDNSDANGAHTAFDPDQIDRALWNLLDNAVRHSPQDGVVTLGVSADARGACIAVSDQGPGVPQDILDRVFDPFFTTKERGSGLGLAIVHRSVAAHGGHVVVDSSSFGARFTVILPRTATPPKAQRSLHG
jgi:signal transduction histidine kinase